MSETTTAPAAPLTPGSTVSITNLYDATYIGEVVSVAGDLVTLRNYAAWHEGATAPFNSSDDDEVRVQVTAETVIDVQVATPTHSVEPEWHSGGPGKSAYSDYRWQCACGHRYGGPIGQRGGINAQHDAHLASAERIAR